MPIFSRQLTRRACPFLYLPWLLLLLLLVLLLRAGAGDVLLPRVAGEVQPLNPGDTK